MGSLARSSERWRRWLPLLLAAGVAWTLVPLVAGAGKPPPGAVARCRDGTYAYSRHHQGTCSHHRGVAVWLDGSGYKVRQNTIVVGKTVPLGRRTKSSGCTLGANPDRGCSPGAYYKGLTRTLICSPGFHTSDIRNVPESEKDAVKREYGLQARSYGHGLEIDHIVPLTLGGSNEIANLFPERHNAHPGYHVKDRLEVRLHALVCSGQMMLRTARVLIASNWQGLYKKVYGAAPTTYR